MEDNRVIECIERAHYILSNLMAVKPGEEVLIAIDPQTDMRMANAMAAAAASLSDPERNAFVSKMAMIRPMPIESGTKMKW